MSVFLFKKPVEYYNSPNTMEDYSTINAVENNVTYLLRRIDDRIVSATYNATLNAWVVVLANPIVTTAISVGDYVNVICDSFTYVEQACEVVAINIGANSMSLRADKPLTVPVPSLNDIFINYKQNWVLNTRTQIAPNRVTPTDRYTVNEQKLTCDSQGYIYLNPAPDVRPHITAIKDNLGIQIDWKIEISNLLPFMVGYAEQFKGMTPGPFVNIYSLDDGIPEQTIWASSMLLAGLPSGNPYNSNMKTQTGQLDVLGTNVKGVKPLVKMVSNVVYGFKGAFQIIQLNKEWGFVNGLNNISQLSYTAEVQDFQGNPVASSSNSMSKINNNIFIRFKPYLATVPVPLTARTGYYEIEVDGITYVRRDYEIKTICWDSFKAKKTLYVRWLNTLGSFEHCLFDVIEDNQESTDNGEFLAYSPFLKNENVKQKIQQERQSNLLITSKVKAEDVDAFADLISSHVVQVFEFPEGVTTPDELLTYEMNWRDIEVLNNAFKKPIRKGEHFVVSYDINYKRHHPQNVIENALLPTSTGAYCAPADYVLQNTLGTTLGAGSINSGASSNIVAPDGNVTIEYADGTPILTEPIPSGVSKIVSVPTPSGWYRPSEWIDVPEPLTNEAYFLFAVFENAPNQIAISIAVSGSGTSVVEIYDGVNPLPFNTYTSGYNNLSVNWSDCDPSTFIPELGYRQCIFKIKSIGGDLVSLNFGLAHATYGGGKVINILDYVNNIVTTGNTYFFSFGYTQQLPYMLEQARYLGSIGFSKQNWLYNCVALKSLVLPNGVVSESFRDAFSYCGLDYFPDNVIIRPSYTYGSFYGSSFKKLVIDMINETNGTFSNHVLSKIQDLELLNCGGITASIGSLALPSLHRLILNQYRLSFTIANSLLFKEQAQLDLVNSLADLTGGTAQNITMTGLTQYPSVTALANSKNWNILI